MCDKYINTIMNNHVLFNNHQLIANSNQYFIEQKYISIHSEDRDITKYPNSAEFEIMLPQEYLNIASARLYSWSFPANYDVFSIPTYNVTMTFKFNNIYNPAINGLDDVVLQAIHDSLIYFLEDEYLVTIEPGFYNPDQIATELTNKFNESVTNTIIRFFNLPENADKYEEAKLLFNGYSRFNIAYNTVAQKLWFGNSAEQFTLTNDSATYAKRITVDGNCLRRNMLPEFANWGLPAYLGFLRTNAESNNVQDFIDTTPNGGVYIGELNGIPVPRFFYGDAETGTGDNGYWLLPTLPNASVYFLQAPFKVSFMGPAYIYMEVDGMNCIDETAPYNLSKYTMHTNQTNGIVLSSFAKIPVPTTPISQWFDNNMECYKYWNPPAERISKLKIKFRYHNGALVDFGQFEYSFMLEFNILRPQQERAYSIRNAFDLSQHQAYSSKFIT